ncbi:MAG TPA: PepSY-like domain-containing protein [Candidatus Nitrosotenuis sp.]|nr:PepSY-like domain-containing protein [Candidatus Nitrosotenuis sp.]
MNHSRILRTLAAGIVCALFFAYSNLAQEKEPAAEQENEKKLTRKDVPAPVLAAFTKAYPMAKVIGYTQETEGGKTAYEIESTEGKIHRDVLYWPDGTLIVVEESLPVTEMPRAVQDAIKKASPSGVVEISEILKRGKTVEYEVLIKEGAKKFELVLDPAGRILKREDKN